MTDGTMPKPLNADPDPPRPENDPGPKGAGTLWREVQPPNADPIPDDKPDTGTTTKPDGTLGGDVEPGDRG